MEKVIFLVDMLSFYASVEKADNSELTDKPVLVAGDPKRRSGIILAACPLAKKYGVKTAESLWEAKMKCPDAVVVKPRMQRYIDVSYQITTILEGYTDLVEPYSIDEQFMDVTGSQKLFGDPLTIATKIQDEIKEHTGVYARVGIGSNKLLAKMACDVFAKKLPSGIFSLNAENIKEKMWPLPIGEMFAVGSNMKKHLHAMGIMTIGSLANYPVHMLKKRWGINGEVLWQNANGIDYSPVTNSTHNQQKAIGHQMTLPRNYQNKEEIKVILLELSEEVARRARFQQYRGSTVALSIRGADFQQKTGFHHQKKLAASTDFGMDIFYAVYSLFCFYWDGSPIRSAAVILAQLEDNDMYQLNLFDFSLRKEQLNKAMDKINEKYGRTALIRASSLTAAGQVFVRANKIGGHYK